MPLDSRRLPVPEGTFSPHLFSNSSKIQKNVRRKDRKPDDSRPIFLRVGVNSNAKGSAYLEMGKTKIVTSVFGPRESSKHQDFSVKGHLFCQFKFAPFSCQQRRSHQQDQQERELSAVLTETLEPAVCLNKFPKSTIDVFVLVLENDGGALAGSITCAGAAVADAGIDMYDVVVGCSLRLLREEIFVDPTAEEEFNPLIESNTEDEDGNMTLGFMPTFQQVAAFVQNGSMQPETVSQGLKVLIEKCKDLSLAVQQCLLQSVKHQSIVKADNDNKRLPPAS